MDEVLQHNQPLSITLLYLSSCGHVTCHTQALKRMYLMPAGQVYIFIGIIIIIIGTEGEADPGAAAAPGPAGEAQHSACSQEHSCQGAS